MGGRLEHCYRRRTRRSQLFEQAWGRVGGRYCGRHVTVRVASPPIRNTLTPELCSRKSIMHYFKQMPTVLEDQERAWAGEGQGEGGVNVKCGL